MDVGESQYCRGITLVLLAESVSMGLADKLWIVYTTKGARQRLQSFCEKEIHDDIVGRQYNLLRWMVFD